MGLFSPNLYRLPCHLCLSFPFLLSKKLLQKYHQSFMTLASPESLDPKPQLYLSLIPTYHRKTYCFLSLAFHQLAQVSLPLDYSICLPLQPFHQLKKTYPSLLILLCQHIGFHFLLRHCHHHHFHLRLNPDPSPHLPRHSHLPPHSDLHLQYE